MFPRGLARVAVVLEIFLGVGAVGGGLLLALAPDGHLLRMPITLLATTPFRTFFVPGLILLTLVGIVPLLAATLAVRRHALAPLAAMAVGLTLVGWITVEMVMLAGFGSLAWAAYLVLGTSIVAVGVAWRSASRRSKSLKS